MVPEERPIGRVALPPPLAALVSGLDRVIAFFWNNLFLYGILVAAALWASWWGYTDFYGSQYGRVPWYTWPFVPDSPLSTTAWVVASLGIKSGFERWRGVRGAGWALFVNWAAMMNVKVGIWTAFVLLFFYDHFFVPGREWFQWMLIGAHLGMVAFAVMLLRKTRTLPASGYVLVLALAFLWDFMDYVYVSLAMPDSGVTIFPNGVPTDPGPIQDVVAPVTMALSLGASLFVWLFMRLRGPPVER